MRVIALTFALSAASAAALGAFRSNVFLGSEMRPDMVAQTLKKMEDEWKAQAHVSAECKTQSGLRVCDEASKAFHNSCSKVVRAVMLGSQGDSAKVSEYMTTVCSQKTISGWHRSVCGFVGQSMVAKMSANAADNRENHVAKADATCDGLWVRFVEEQTEQVAIEAQAKAKAEAEAKAKAEKEAKEKAEKEAKEKAEKEAKAKAEEAIKLEKEAKAKAEKAKAEAEAKEKARFEKEATAEEVIEADKVEDATIAATKSVSEDKAKIKEKVVKQADAIEAHMKAAFKSAPDAKVQEAEKSADANIAADAKTADAKMQEAETTVVKKVKEADAVEANIQAAFKSAIVALPNVAVVKK